MPSVSHEVVVELFRARPDLVSLLLGSRVSVPAHLRDASATLGQVTPTEYRADLVLRGDTVAVVVEVQLAHDPDKRWIWPAYVATLRARLRVDVLLVVVTLSAPVAAWAGSPIHLGHPGHVLTPLVVSPGEVPALTDPATALRCPELAVLSAMVHGAGPHAASIGRSALAAVRGLDEERVRLYSDLILGALNAAARVLLEREMLQNYQYQSDLFKGFIAKGVEEGREMGLEEGRSEQAAQAVLDVLSARGLQPTEAERLQLREHRDLDQLRALLRRAVTVGSVAELFEAVAEGG